MQIRQLLLLPFILTIAIPLCAAGNPKLLDGVPDVVQKTDYSCGCAALQSVLAYWGIDLQEEQITKAAKVDPKVGAEMEDLVKVAVAQGCVAVIKEKWTLKDLYKELKAKRPIIVLIQAWRENKKRAWKDEWDDGHYVVVIGMDRKNVYVEDPSLEDARGKIPLKEFVERWHCWTRDGRKTTGQAIVVGRSKKSRKKKLLKKKPRPKYKYPKQIKAVD